MQDLARAVEASTAQIRSLLPPPISHNPPTFEQIVEKVDREMSREHPVLSALSAPFEALFGLR